MTIKKLQQSVREEFGLEFPSWATEEVLSFLSTTIERVAREVFQEILPEEIEVPEDAKTVREATLGGQKMGRNLCITEARKKFNKFMEI